MAEELPPFPGEPGRQLPDPVRREALANAVLGVAVDTHRQEVESRLGQLPAGTDIRDVPGPHQHALRRAHARAIMADTSDGGSYQQLREAEPFVPSRPGDPAPFPGEAQPIGKPVEHPQQ